MIPLVLKGKVLSYIPYEELVELDADMVSHTLSFINNYQELYKISVMNNRPKTLELLIKRGSNIDYTKKDFTIYNNVNGFNYASMKGYISIVKLLLSLPASHGIDASAGNNYAIRMASDNSVVL